MNYEQMKKAEIISRLRFSCKHGHNGFGHPKCYDKMFGVEEKIVFFDIESTNLVATFGYMLCYCLKPIGGKVIKRVIDPEDIRKRRYDKNLCKQFVEDIKKYDRIITHYGSRFDLPFIRTRCVYWGIEFPGYKQKHQSDTWRILRSKFRLHSNRMETACDLFNIQSKGHRLNPNVWMAAQAGDKRSLSYILTHCAEDVISLEALWLKINEFVVNAKTSI